jgi:hypothetical protein
VCCSSNKTIQRHWFNGGFIRIMVKKNLRENPFSSGTSRLLKQVAFVLRRRIRADDQAARLWNAFVRRFSVVRRNPQRGQAGNWVTSFTCQCGGCCVRDCLSGRTNFNCCRSYRPMIDHIGETFVPICWTTSKRTICFWTKLFSVTRLPLTCQGRWIAII